MFSESNEFYFDYTAKYNPIVMDGRLPHEVTRITLGTQNSLIIYHLFNRKIFEPKPIFDIVKTNPGCLPVSSLLPTQPTSSISVSGWKYAVEEAIQCWLGHRPASEAKHPIARDIVLSMADKYHLHHWQ